ncbi:hypothetical protein ACFRIC_09285 [Streptomyces sp. NPDC056738]|uniref:hypothetical protein n=1 Tax=Streptomyces sp. NPDC056738 TaxID=3345933 RepID=UPI00369B2880
MLIPSASTEFLHIPVSGPAGVDLTGTAPKIAILAGSTRTNPAAGDWKTGDWTDDGEARLLIGPDGGVVTLDPGDYRVWVTIDPPGSELIVRLAGYLSVS